MKLIARTLYGLEQVLADELVSLGAKGVSAANRAVIFEGSKSLLYLVNYSSATALSFLVPLAEFNIRTKDDLYNGCLKIHWNDYLKNDSTFTVVPVVNSPLFKHTGFPALVVKDSIADYFRKKTGRRPSVDALNPDIVVNLHVSNQKVTVSLDSTVIPLYKRGYRTEQTIAPVNEVLAAGILRLTRWNRQSLLIDPMCGSGTIPIEAAMLASGMPAGRYRSFFGFQKWQDYDENLFREIRLKEEEKIRKTDIKIQASDISNEAVGYARSNIKRAGVGELIELNTADFKDIKPVSAEGVLVMNPPYGQRITPEDIDSLYSMIGTTLKHNFSGFNAWILSANREALKNVGLKTASRHILFNGALECMLAGYELYTGSRKAAGKSTM
ncbi:MAG TPA: class I SAM-dependent RNA methyltransferase [Bacteroidales bacterium]|nr:class I SAM-dependent RNA methyltransferase [Bacteroidales bacterium]